MVSPPPPSLPLTLTREPAQTEKTLDERLSTELLDVHFDYDKSSIRDDARAVVERNATALKSILTDFPDAEVLIEGHSDARGSAEYSLGLADWRAEATRDWLVKLGVPGDRLQLISYGSEQQLCGEPDEACWQKERRTHIAAAPSVLATR
jgi:peptidoglycan-associated lipoprotein